MWKHRKAGNTEKRGNREVMENPCDSKIDENDLGSLSGSDGVPLSSNGETSNNSGVFTITQEMIEVEEQLEFEFRRENQKLREEMKEQRDKERKDQCFKRLQHLLERSNTYAQFLIDRIEKQKVRSEKKGKAQERKKLKELQQPSVIEQRVHNSRKCRVVDPQHVESPKHPMKRKCDISSNMVSEEIATESKNSSKKIKCSRKNEEEIQISDLFNKEDLHAGMLKQEQPEEFVDTFSRTINGEKVSDRQPLLVSGGVMRSYQLDAFDWLKMLYENGVNAILADEMGLGKTIECISLIAHLIEKGVSGPYIIICPLSTLKNWVQEFRRFTPLIPVISYHGDKEERKVLREELKHKVPVLKNLIHPVLITSYSIALRDRPHLSGYKWVIVVDEAHRIKNFECLLIRELKRYDSCSRLLLTGTPLQNNLAELWSLLNFLLPEIFDDLQVFHSWFDIAALTQADIDEKIIAQEREKRIISTIHQILSPFLLRRTKADVALDLPPKREVFVYAPLTVRQKELYAATVDNTIRKLLLKKSDGDLLHVEGKRKRKEVNYCELNHKQDIIELESDNESPSNGESQSHVEDEVLPKPKNFIPSDVAKLEYDCKGKNNLAVVNVKMNNVRMMLRKICNHPYLVEFPLDPTTDDYLIDENLIKSCGKLSVLDLMLRELKKRKHKVLIFSQFVIMLEILQYYCELRGYATNYFDGSTPLGERQEQINDFNTNPSSFLFLLSTRSGGLGINLTAADTVIIYDSDWNPQLDIQAQDRCHRIGQTKPVVVYRLVTPKTIDEKIVERAYAKRKLEKMIIRDGRFSSQDKIKHNMVISQKELLELLQSKAYTESANIEDVISPARLNMLLDRSDMVWSTETKCKKKSNQVSVPMEVTGLFKVVEQMDSFK